MFLTKKLYFKDNRGNIGDPDNDSTRTQLVAVTCKAALLTNGKPIIHPARPASASQKRCVSELNRQNITKNILADVLCCLAERVGFEPTVTHNATPDFESGTFDHSDTSPKRINNNGAHSTSNLQFRAEWPYAKPITTLASGIGQLEPAAGCVRSTASGMERRQISGYRAESRTGR